MKLKEFYSNFFNGSFCRDLRVVYPQCLVDGVIATPKASLLHHFNYPKRVQGESDMSNIFYKFLLNKNHRDGTGNTYYEITHYNTLENYRNKSNSQPYTDRLFFDFDLEEEPRISAVKTELKIARNYLTGKEARLAEKEARNDFKEVLTTTDVLETPFEEAMRLNDYFNNKGVKTLLLFSGSKGLALNVLFDKLPINHISEISFSLATSLKEQLNLTTLDLAVNKDAKARLQRIPYTKHNNTLLMNQPIDPSLEFDEFLDVIKDTRPKVMDLDITDYYDNSFITDLLVKFDHHYSLLDKEFKEEKAKEDKVRKGKPTKQNYYNKSLKNKDDVFADCRILARVLLGEPVKEYGDYNSYNCPFHNDNVASARAYEGNFYCAACNVHYGYFNFIKALKEVETGKRVSDDDVKKEMRKIKRNVREQG